MQRPYMRSRRDGCARGMPRPAAGCMMFAENLVIYLRNGIVLLVLSEFPMKTVVIVLSLLLFNGIGVAKEKPFISKKEAERKARVRFPDGRVISSKLVQERGDRYWAVEMDRHDALMDVWLDARTGEMSHFNMKGPSRGSKAQPPKKKSKK